MMLEFLESEQINPELIQGIRAYRKEFRFFVKCWGKLQFIHHTRT